MVQGDARFGCKASPTTKKISMSMSNYFSRIRHVVQALVRSRFAPDMQPLDDKYLARKYDFLFPGLMGPPSSADLSAIDDEVATTVAAFILDGERVVYLGTRNAFVRPPAKSVVAIDSISQKQ